MSFKDYLVEASPKKEYEQLLKNHDWTYMYSDDRRAYKKGQESWKKILELKDAVDKDGKIMAKYAPNKKFDSKKGVVEKPKAKPESRAELAKKAKTQKQITNDINNMMLAIKKRDMY